MFTSLSLQRTRPNTNSHHPKTTFSQTKKTKTSPYPIILGSILTPKSVQKYWPIEFTPLYIGSPSAAGVNVTPVIGGGFVAPLGFNSQPPGEGPARTASMDGSKSVNVDPIYTVPLVTMVGVSSSFVAQGLVPQSDVAQDLAGSEELSYWNNVRFDVLCCLLCLCLARKKQKNARAHLPLRRSLRSLEPPPQIKQFNYTGERLGFADGGGVDNTAIIPLLRRRVTKIIAGTATTAPLDTNSTDWAKLQWDIAGLFGAVSPDSFNKTGKVNNMPVADFNSFMQVCFCWLCCLCGGCCCGRDREVVLLNDALTQQHPYKNKTKVFPKAGYQALYDEWQAQNQAGKNTAVRTVLKVLDNPAQGVTGGWEVREGFVCFRERGGGEREALMRRGLAAAKETPHNSFQTATQQTPPQQKTNKNKKTK